MIRANKIGILLLLFFVALALRAYALDASGFAEDEMNKLTAARGYLAGDFSQNLEHPMLMKSAIACSLAVADRWNAASPERSRIADETAVRLPNVVAGALATFALYALVALYFGDAVGMLAAGLWATGGLAIAVNRVAKEDTFFVLFMLVGFYLYERAKRLGDADTRRQRSLFLASGASFGLMLASKYFAHYLGLLFLFYFLVGTRPTNRALTRAAYVAFFGGLVVALLAANPILVAPGTLAYFAHYAGEGTVTHHGYVLMDRIYANDLGATPGGLPLYFYVLMLALKVPLAVLAFAVAGIAVAVSRRGDRGAFFLLFMFVMWLVPYSLVAGKWLRYVVALMPFVYALAAVGAVGVWRVVAVRLPAGMRTVLGATLATLLVGASLSSSARWAPYYALELNALGAGRVAYFFPHDELYDVGLRESLEQLARVAPPDGLVLCEAPGVARYYLDRFSRQDLAVAPMTGNTDTGRRNASPCYVVVQPGRLYVENVEFVRNLRATSAPIVQATVAGAPAVEIYRTDVAGSV